MERFEWGSKMSIAYGGVDGLHVQAQMHEFRGELCDMWDG